MVSIIDTNAGQPDAYGAGNCAGRTAEAQRLFMAESVALTARRGISFGKTVLIAASSTLEVHIQIFCSWASVRGEDKSRPKRNFREEQAEQSFKWRGLPKRFGPLLAPI